MNIVATAVEPEFVKLTNLGGGAVCLTIEIARMEVTMVEERKTGSIQLNLLPADMTMIRMQLGEIIAEEKRRLGISND